MQLFNDFAHILGEWPSGSPEWLAARGCGASTIPDLAAFERWTRDPQGVKPPKRTPWVDWAAICQSEAEKVDEFRTNPGPKKAKKKRVKKNPKTTTETK